MTRPTKIEPGRWYDDACGAAHGLELVGERWALLVMRELMFGPLRFGDLREALPGISANVLSQRLEGLLASGIVARRVLPPPVSAQVYALTPWGLEAEPILQTLGRWAARSRSHDPTLPISAASVLLSFRTLLDEERAKGVDATVGLYLQGGPYVARVAGGGITIRRATPEDVDATFRGTAAALASVVYGGRALADAQVAGDLAVEGDKAVAKRFLKLFRLPPKAEPGTTPPA